MLRCVVYRVLKKRQDHVPNVTGLGIFLIISETNFYAETFQSVKSLFKNTFSFRSYEGKVFSCRCLAV